MRNPPLSNNKELNPTLQISDDIVIQEDFEFKPSTQPQRPLQQLQKLSILALLFSICQLTYSGLSFSHSSSPFIFSSVLIGLISLLLSSILAIWASITLRIERDKTLLTQDTSNLACEKLSRIMFPAFVFRTLASCALIPHVIMQRNYTSSIESNTLEYSALASILLTMLPFMEVITGLIFLRASWTSFKYLKAAQTISNLIFLSNLVLMGSSLALVYNTLSVNHPVLSSSIDYQGFLFLGTSAAILTLFVWLVNSRKWRAPSLLITGALTILTLSLAIFIVTAYTNANDSLQFSQDLSFIKLINWSTITCFSSLLIVIGNSYMLKTYYRDTAPRSKRNYAWLAILITMVIVFIAALSLGPVVLKENQPLDSQTIDDQPQMMQMNKNEDRDRWFGGSGLEMDSDLTRKISRMFFSKSSRYLTMRLNKEHDHIMLTGSGDYSKQYEDLVNSLEPYRAEIALVRVPLDSSHDALVGIVWVPPSISPREKETYLRYYAVDSTDPRSERLGFPVYVATSKEDLDREVVLTNAFRFRSVLLEDQFLEANEMNLIMERQEMMTVLMETMESAGFKGVREFSPEDVVDIYNMLLGQKYKFIIFKGDPVAQEVYIEAKGDWWSTYDNFTQYFRSEETRAACIYLDVDGKTKLVFVIFEGRDLADITKDMGGIENVLDIQLLERMGVYIYVAHKLEDLKLENLIAGINPDSTIKQQIICLIEDPNALSQWSLTPEQRAKFESLDASKDDVIENINARVTDHIQNIVKNTRLTLAAAEGELSAKDTQVIHDMILNNKYKFVILNIGTKTPTIAVEAKGDWKSTYDNFLQYFKEGEDRVAYIYLNVDGQTKLAYVIYESEETAEQTKEIGGIQNLPEVQSLQSMGVYIHVAHSLEDLEYENLIDRARSSDTRELQIQTMMKNIRLTLQAEAGPKVGMEIFTLITEQKYKFMLEKYNSEHAQPEIVSRGDWNTTYDTFFNLINPYEAQVGFVFLDLEEERKLVLIIYAPPTRYPDPKAVYKMFNLPTSPHRLESIGITAYLAPTKEDLKLENLLKHIYGDESKIRKLLQELEVVDKVEDSKVYRGITSRMLASDAFSGNDLLNSVKNKAYKYIIMKEDPATNGTKIDSKANFDVTFSSFVKDFERAEIQVAMILLKLETLEKLVVVVYNPRSSGKNTTDILKKFNLPTDLQQYNNNGIGIYTAHSKGQLSLNKILHGIYSNKREIIELLKQYQILNMIDDYEESPSVFCAVCGKHSLDEDQEPSTTFLRERDNMKEIIRDREDVDVVLFGKMGLKLDRDIVKPIKGKKVKYIILKLNEEKKPYIASNGSWYATFDQFQKEFDENVEQVGFIYLDVEGNEELVMVVYAPDSVNRDEKQVIKDFKVTNKNSEKLKKKGISTFVIHDKLELTLDNAVHSVYSANNKPIIKLMQLVEQYSELYELPEDIILQREQTQMELWSRNGLYLSRSIVKAAVGTDTKYVIINRNSTTGKTNLNKQGSWHATFDQFVKDFDPAEDQIGFIHLEIEDERELVMVMYAPNSPNKTFDEIFKEFGVAKSVEKLKKNDISLYFARSISDLTLEKILNRLFNHHDPDSPPPATVITSDVSQLQLPSDIGDAIKNQKYKYVILKHDDKKDETTIEKTGDWGSNYRAFLKDFSHKQDNIAFVHIDIESKPQLVLIVFAYRLPATQILRSFGLPDDEAKLESGGVKVYVAHRKKELKVLDVLEGVYSHDTLTDDIENKAVMLFEEKDLALGKDVVDALTNKKYKYLICKHDLKTDVTTVESTGKWGSTYKDFVKDFSKKDKQIGFVFLEVEAKEILVLIVYSPKTAGTQALREFGIPDDVETLNNLGIKPYVARKKKDLDLTKVLEGVYTEGIFDKSNPVILLSDDEEGYTIEDYIDESTDGSDEGYMDEDDYYDWSDEEAGSDSSLGSGDQVTEIIRDRDDLNMNFLFGNMGLKLSRNIVKPIKGKKVKYIILKLNEEKKVYTSSNGTWHATFDQFVKELESNVEQVGFIYLEIEGEEKLVMVVYAPDSVNRDEKQVIKDFKVTGKSAEKLRKKGIHTFVVHDLLDLTLDNIVGSVYSAKNKPIITLSELYEVPDNVIDDREGTQMMLFGSKGLKMDKDLVKKALGTDSKYVILLRDKESGKLSLTKEGSWHATFEQFVKDFDPNEDQVGFIYLEIEQERRLVMIIFAPNSNDKTPNDIFKEFDVAKSVEKLEKNDISVQYARGSDDLILDRLLHNIFNHDVATEALVPVPMNLSKLSLPIDIADAMQNKKYKYVILEHDSKKDVTTIQKSGDWTTDYKRFVKDFSNKKDQVALVYLNIESQPQLVLVVFADSMPPSQVLRNFGVSSDQVGIESAGIQVCVIRKDRELKLFKLLEGAYSRDTFAPRPTPALFAEEDVSLLFEEKDLGLGKDVTDALTNKKYKYLICKHDVKSDVTTVESTGKWGSTYKDFVKDFSKKDKQIGFVFLEVEAKEILVLVVYSPKIAGTQALREFGLPSDAETLNKLGIKPYVARKKKDLDLTKVLEGVYTEGTFDKSNPAVFVR